MNFRHLFGCGTEEYDVLLLPAINNNIVPFTALGPLYYQERIPIGVYSSNVMEYMENRITQLIDSPFAIYVTPMKYFIFYKSQGFSLFNFPILSALVAWSINDNIVVGKVNFCETGFC